MKFKTISSIMLLFVWLIALIPNIALAEEDKKSQISALVRALGYGGAIHAFKNYVIRGNDKYRKATEKHFTAAKEILETLRDMGLDTEESNAVDAISTVVDAYLNNLPTAQEIAEKSKFNAERIHMIDEQVKIDDGPAVEGLAILRDKHQMNEVEKIEYAMGYGGAIHNFKNFIMRGDEKYQKKANESFDLSKQSISTLHKMALSQDESNALVDIEEAIQDYQKGLPQIKSNYVKLANINNLKIWNMVLQASDRVVKVNDRRALDGLALLRKKF